MSADVRCNWCKTTIAAGEKAFPIEHLQAFGCVQCAACERASRADQLAWELHRMAESLQRAGKPVDLSAPVVEALARYREAARIAADETMAAIAKKGGGR